MEEMKALHVVANEHFGSSFSQNGLHGKTVDVRLVREPENRFDENAVGVHIGRNQVGYLSAARAAKVAKWLDAIGGTLSTSLNYSSGGADVLVPAHWVSVPREQRVNIQQTKKFQDELTALGFGKHKCKVASDGSHLNVAVDGIIIGKLYPNQIDQSSLDKIVHGRMQTLEIAKSAHRDGLLARIVIPAPKAPKAPKPTTQSSTPNTAEPAATADKFQRQKSRLEVEPFIKRLFSR